MTVATKTLITTIEGPKGKAELFEVADDSTSMAVQYAVDFDGQSHEYLTMGEADIEAGELAGTPT